jgi:transposase
MPSKKMTKKQGTRPNYTPEFRAGVVKLCLETGKGPSEAAREMGVSVSAVSAWLRQAKADAGGGGSGALTSSEREELAALRRENRVLRQERDILKRATAFFAREGTS